MGSKKQNAEYWRQWRLDHPGYTAAVKRRQRERNPSGVVAATHKWTRANREKVAAQWKLQRAVKCGRIKRGLCIVCGDPKTQGHHHDYSKPLEVTWVCNLHHKLFHMKSSCAPTLGVASAASRMEHKHNENKTNS